MAAEDAEAAALLSETLEDVEIDRTWDWVWHAWWALGAGDRANTVEGVSVPMGGMIIRTAPGPIRWTAVREWIKARRLDEHDAEILERCVTIMDRVFIDWWREKNKVEVAGG